MERSWPRALWIVRHGQSGGPAVRDLDVPLSALGMEQAAALGRWFAGLPAEQRPTRVIASPYLRARQTAEQIALAGGLSDADAEVIADERLREMDLGILDGLSAPTIHERYPEQEALRHRMGEFYYRPPGGESWCDVVLRVRALTDAMTLHAAGERILMVSHESVVLALRYVLEALTDEEMLTLSRAHDLANCALTSYLPSGAGLELERFNFVAPLVHGGAPVTRRTDTTIPSR
jgi:probable phosphoglycerate mutase